VGTVGVCGQPTFARTRSLSLLLSLLVPGAAACSMFAPSYDEFASGSEATQERVVCLPRARQVAMPRPAARTSKLPPELPGARRRRQQCQQRRRYGRRSRHDRRADPDPVRSQTVSADDVRLQAVNLTGLATFAALTRYDVTEAQQLRAARRRSTRPTMAPRRPFGTTWSPSNCRRESRSSCCPRAAPTA